MGVLKEIYRGNNPFDFNTCGSGVYFCNFWDPKWTSAYHIPFAGAWASVISFSALSNMKVQIAIGNHGEFAFRLFDADTLAWGNWYRAAIQ